MCMWESSLCPIKVVKEPQRLKESASQAEEGKAWALFWSFLDAVDVLKVVLVQTKRECLEDSFVRSYSRSVL